MVDLVLARRILQSHQLGLLNLTPTFSTTRSNNRVLCIRYCKPVKQTTSKFYIRMHFLKLEAHKSLVSPLCHSPFANVLLILHFPDSSQESHLGEKNVPRHGSKIGHAYGHGNGGRVIGAGENANNGGSRSPNGQGGTAFIPVYAAGAANNHNQNHHHGSGNSNQNSIGVSILILVAATLASLITHLYY
jgi:hypothetical protein